MLVKIERSDVTVVFQFSKDLECRGCEIGDTVAVKKLNMVIKLGILQCL